MRGSDGVIASLPLSLVVDVIARGLCYQRCPEFAHTDFLHFQWAVREPTLFWVMLGHVRGWIVKLKHGSWPR